MKCQFQLFILVKYIGKFIKGNLRMIVTRKEWFSKSVVGIRLFLMLLLLMMMLCWLLQLNPGVRGEQSHQPAFMSSCLTINHTCLPCLPSGTTLLFLSDLFVVGRAVNWERWESRELRGWKRGRVVSWEGGKGVWGWWGGKVGEVEG